MQRLSLAAAALCAMLALTACGSSETETVTQVTVVKTEAAAAPSEDRGAESGAEEPEAVAEDEEPAKVAEASAGNDENSGGDITVPNVVGKDHQLAQDTMQDAGLYNLAEEDASGQDRPLLWDRNWVVVSQSPLAGSKVSSDKTITLRSKKDTD